MQQGKLYKISDNEYNCFLFDGYIKWVIVLDNEGNPSTIQIKHENKLEIRCFNKKESEDYKESIKKMCLNNDLIISDDRTKVTNLLFS
jgi:hypothetical protein